MSRWRQARSSAWSSSASWFSHSGQGHSRSSKWASEMSTRRCSIERSTSSTNHGSTRPSTLGVELDVAHGGLLPFALPAPRSDTPVSLPLREPLPQTSPVSRDGRRPSENRSAAEARSDPRHAGRDRGIDASTGGKVEGREERHLCRHGVGAAITSSGVKNEE